VLVELADQTIGAAAKVRASRSPRSGIGNGSGPRNVPPANQVPMLVRCFNGRSVDDKTQKQKRQQTCKHSGRAD
jgi:hypothetical protein